MLKNLAITIFIYLFIGCIYSTDLSNVISQSQKYEEHDSDIILISSADEIMESKLFLNFPQDTHIIIVLLPQEETTNNNITLDFPSWLDYELYDTNSATSFIQASTQLNSIHEWDSFFITAFAHLISEKQYLTFYIGSQLLSSDLTNYTFKSSPQRKNKRQSFLEVLSQENANTRDVWEQIWKYRFGDPTLNCAGHAPFNQENVSETGCIPRGLPKAFRSSISPASATYTTCAIVTMIRNEAHF